MSPSFLTEMERKARGLGFSALGVTHPSPTPHMEFYRRWLDRGHHGEMGYLAREDSVARREDLCLTFSDIRSVVVVTQEYYQEDGPGVPQDPCRGVVARYARGEDYHVLIKSRLQELLVWLGEAARERGLAEEVRGFGYVDTGPILERDLARRAGLGWFGKNTMLIHPRRGSYFFIGLLLTDLELPTTPSFRTDHCGSCRACLDACPTGALLGVSEEGAPVMDARRCISYLTIELKGPIPRELRATMGNRVFGCDICQEVCPWNWKFAEPAREPAYRAGPDTEGPDLVRLLAMTEGEFATRFSGSPVKRAKRRGLLRNVAVALGNWGRPEAAPVLISALDDPEPLIRGHAAWALGRILEHVGIPGDGGHVLVEALLDRLEEEEEEWVKEELEAALRG